VGGSVLGLFFLLVDSMGGRPFFTPSVLASVLFLGVPATSVVEVRLDMVAYFTAIHFAAFGALGMGLAVMVYEVELHSRRPGQVMAGLFLVLEGGFLAAANLLMPGVIDVIGFGRVVVGNLLTALAMALFMLRSHRPDAWRKLLRGRPID
jgi:peptidoglycan/LPS O-acetylase OafA/YrhL